MIADRTRRLPAPPPWWVLLFIMLVLGLVARRDLVVLLAVLLLAATGASELWARHCLTGVTYRRHLGREQIGHGEETTLTLEVINAKPLPLAWLLVRDRFPRRLALLTAEVNGEADPSRGAGIDGSGEALRQQTGFLRTLVALRWYERVRRTHRVVGRHRGVYLLGPASLSSGDTFGFRRAERDDDHRDLLTVYPRVVPVASLGLPAARPVGEWATQRRLQEDPLRFLTVRDYVPGDSPRHIHWKATARTGRLQTKVFEPSAAPTLCLALDVQSAPEAYRQDEELFEFAVCAAASICVHALSQRHAVGLYANAGAQMAGGPSPRGGAWAGSTWDVAVRVRPGRSPRQSGALLAALAGVESVRGLPFEALLYDLRPDLPFGATLLALTAAPREAVYEALLAVVRAGHPVLLLTVGDECPEVASLIAHYHLGGRDAWQRLETLVAEGAAPARSRADLVTSGARDAGG